TFVCAPLHYQDKVIGTLELISPRPGDLNATHLPKLEEVLPLFSMAVQRSVEELDTRVQAMIKEKCTAIHPVVEWRFRKAVFNTIERKSESVSDAAAQIQRSLSSGDETGIVGFLHANVESLFDHLGKFGTDVRARIELYRGALDARLGVVYRRRQFFEESVTRIAEAISAHIDREELA